ncbi:MAG: aminotransferase class V-fold PLP-dependent enzyme [Candidatus Aminicenantes bacterium]|jgi:cysteine desulfurase family protein|nr:aminotransferase class V-fold PLP-dependent enzyme [Candidatus Aminicenantes bacterium]
MDKMIYLDNGATSFPKPEAVYKYMDHFYRNYGVNPGRSGYDLCIESGEVVENTRKQLTKFFNGTDPDRLCFSYNSTDSLNLVINGILEKGDHAVTTNVEHNSVLRPLYHQSKYNGVEVDYISADSKGFVNPDDFPKKFKKNTKLVIVNHASNVIGTIQPIKEIGKYCREKGILFAVDASQSSGKIPVDMEEQNIDIVVFTGHKSLLGPTGIGGLYVREGVEIRHTRAGGTGVRSAVKTHLFEYPFRLEYGTLNSVGVAGLYKGVEWVEEKGIHNIHEHEMKLTTMLRDGLKDTEGVTLYCQDDLTDHIGIFLFNVAGFESLNVGTLLDVDYNIACRTGLHCAPLIHVHIGTADIHGAVRLGVGPFNTEADVKTTIDAVKEIALMKQK